MERIDTDTLHQLFYGHQPKLGGRYLEEVKCFIRPKQAVFVCGNGIYIYKKAIRKAEAHKGFRILGGGPHGIGNAGVPVDAPFPDDNVVVLLCVRCNFP